MLTLEKLVISPQKTLKEVMQQMTANQRGIVFVCNEDMRLLGVLTDGDLRRAMLDNLLLMSPISKSMNTDPIIAHNIDEANHMLRKFLVAGIPVIDDHGHLQSVILDNGTDSIIVEPQVSHVTPVSQRILAIIPARGGSKRIPKKNLAIVAGKSLLAWAIQTAQDSKYIDNILISTDDTEIAQEAQSMGVEIPWLRPSHLAADTTSTLDVILHALDWAFRDTNYAPEFAVLLEPTAPMRDSELVDQAIELLINSDADSVVSVSELPHTLNPDELLVIRKGNLAPYAKDTDINNRRLRGEQSAVYVQNGLVYVFRAKTILDQRTLYGTKTIPFVNDWDYFVDVDVPSDLVLADIKKSIYISRGGS